MKMLNASTASALLCALALAGCGGGAPEPSPADLPALKSAASSPPGRLAQHLAGCPAAASGTYRSIALDGRTHTGRFDFEAMMYWPDDSSAAGWTLSPIAPCEFTAVGRNERGEVETVTFAIGKHGAGIFRATSSQQPDDWQSSAIGHVFPVQMHAVPELKGVWNMLESGAATVGQSAAPGHSFSRVSLHESGSASVCENGLFEEQACKDAPTLALVTNPRGGFDLKEAKGASRARARLFAFRGFDGLLTLYGTMNPAGDELAPRRTVLVGAPARRLDLPPESAVVRYWEVSNIASGWTGFYNAGAVQMARVDPVAGTVTRLLNADSPSDQYDVLHYNRPIDGVRFRPARTWTNHRGMTSYSPDMFYLPLASGAVVVVNANTVDGHHHSIALFKPN
ncbi:hypothetical protein WG922_11505 [Ramlibacter sp. AN1015]|uniref:hypothetical protein n=1 Tax=Ramlibacter sp. AN1015 TaxID=3133428 RepID=UPI0030BAD0A5